MSAKTNKDEKGKDKDHKKELPPSPEESLQKLIDNARTKSEAYKKILNSLNTNKNID